MSAGIRGKDVELLEPCDRLLLRMALCIERLLAINDDSKPVHVGKVRHSAKGLVREANRRLRSKAAVEGIKAARIEPDPYLEGIAAKTAAREAVTNYRTKFPELYALWEDECRDGDTRMGFQDWVDNVARHMRENP